MPFDKPAATSPHRYSACTGLIRQSGKGDTKNVGYLAKGGAAGSAYAGRLPKARRLAKARRASLGKGHTAAGRRLLLPEGGGLPEAGRSAKGSTRLPEPTAAAKRAARLGRLPKAAAAKGRGGHGGG